MLGLLKRIRKSIWAGYLFPLPLGALAWAGHVALYHAGAANAPYLPFLIAMLLAGIIGGVGPGLVTLVIAKSLAMGVIPPLFDAAPMPSSNHVATIAVLGVALIMLLFADFSTRAVIKLDDTTQKLRAMNETLEARIQERSAALRIAEENLRQAQKMEAIGQLTGGIAHDFNNLLTSIMGSLERLHARFGTAPAEELARYIAAAEDATTRAATLTNRLLAFARRQPLTPRGTDTGCLIVSMADLIHRSIGPAIALDILAPSGRHAVLVDPNQLEHALLNLCINASDAMPNGGTLRIATAGVTLAPPQATALDLAPGDYVTLTVADTGTGMAPETLARAFDPFFTTKPIGQGTGLGLSMIYGFARQSGGHAQITSTLGVGTTVTLYLPRHLGAVESAAQPAQAATTAAVPAQGETILIVDDEANIRALAAEVLQEHGYHVLQAGDAVEALQLLCQDQPLHLLITDLGLPGLSGSGLADTALRLRPGLKILFITGYAARAEPALPPAHGQLLLQKPFSMASLATRVRELLASPS